MNMRKTFLKKLIAKTGYTIASTKALEKARDTLSRRRMFEIYFANAGPDFVFVQVGANDGVTEDPIYPYVSKYKLKGIVIEPVPDVFALLKENYRGLPVTCLNIAIGDPLLTFYAPKRNRLTGANAYKNTRTASFNKDIVRRSLKVANADELIEAVPVEVRRFEEVMRDNGIERIDFLQIDCEGYDFEVLMQALKNHRPRVINFENEFLTDKEECNAMLRSLGYKVFDSEADTVAYLD